MDYQNLKDELRQITGIVADVPEPYREKCFFMLLEHLLAATSRAKRDEKPDQKEQKKEEPDERKPPATALNAPGIVKAFLRKQNLEVADLEKIVMIEDGEFHFIKEPGHSNVAKGQSEWALLLALKNGLVNNSMVVDAESVRSVVQEKGFYDAANFASNFRKPKYAGLFRGQLDPQGDAQALTGVGEAELAAVIKALGSVK